jgi:hypothetical protein
MDEAGGGPGGGGGAGNGAGKGGVLEPVSWIAQREGGAGGGRGKGEQERGGAASQHAGTQGLWAGGAGTRE